MQFQSILEKCMSSNIEKMQEIQDKLNGLLVELQSLGINMDDEDDADIEECEFDFIVDDMDDRLDLLEMVIEMGQEHAERTGDNVFETVLNYYPQFRKMIFETE